MLKQKGFTIVELLIVIVVIAILATISVVAFTGIQKRAYNTSTVQSVRSWVNVLAISYASEGTIVVTPHPDADNPDTICLGNHGEYPDNDDLYEDQCWDNAYIPLDLGSKLADTAHINMQTRMADGFRGIQYGWDASRGSSAYLWYVLEGADQDCVLSGSVSETGDDYTDCIIDVASAVGGVPLDWE